MAKDKQIDFVTNTKESKYQVLGVTYNSNNPYVNSRLDSGILSVDVNEQTGSLLIIEPITQKFINNSILKVLDTQFNYFKFPARTSILEDDTQLDLTLPIQDPIFARYRPSENRKILAGGLYSGILLDDVQAGLSQQYTNKYTISKEIKDSGADLRFRIQIEHRFDTPMETYGTASFSIIKQDANGINREYSTFENIGYTPGIPGSIYRYGVQTENVEFVIPNSSFERGDEFGIGARSGQSTDITYHTINAAATHWVISDASKNVDLWNEEIANTTNIGSTNARPI